jgi:cellulose 1,4-beta-cellobiosidase
MDEDGGMSRYPRNKAGARYGTGYCDANCPRDLRFVSDIANVEGWTPSEDDPNKGYGEAGSCCAQMNIWCKSYLSNLFPTFLT